MTVGGLLLIGGGGHALSVADSLDCEVFISIGIIDCCDAETNSLPFPLVGEDSDLPALFDEGYRNAFITIGSVGDTDIRVRLYDRVVQIGYKIINIVDATDGVSRSVTMATGIYIGNGAVINAESDIGNMAIINTRAVVEHQCRIGEFVHIAPGAILCGNVSVGAHSHIGAGCVVRQGISIGENTTVGIGSVVTRDIGPNVVAFGNPCRVVHKKG